MRKRFWGSTKEWLLMVFGAAALLAAMFFPLRYAFAESLTAGEQQLLDAFRNGELIRIHILANSDSEEDQALKLKVRDTLIETFGQMMAEAGGQSSEAVYAFLQQRTEQMQMAAQACCRQNGFSGRVTAETGVLSLPAKAYGKIVLPEGKYRALRITIGEGEGQNWWCILYPQLCLALADTEESNKQEIFWYSERILTHWLMLPV